MHFEKPKKKSFWEKQGFYVAIAVCLLAVGASSWIAVQRIGGKDFSSVTAGNTLKITFGTHPDDGSEIITAVSIVGGK